MNKNLIVTLVIGLAVVFFFGRRFVSVAPPAATIVEQEEVPQEKPAEKTPELIVEKKSTSVPDTLHLEVQKQSKSAEQKFEEPSDEMEASVQRRELILNQSLIEEMEQHWDDLHLQIRVNREPRGWRVVQVANGSLFARAGLQKNDLITNEIMEALSDQAEAERLPDRFSAILDHVQIP